MCCIDTSKIWAWSIKQILDGNKDESRKVTHANMVIDMKRGIDYSASRGTNIVDTSDFQGEFGDVVFIERFWTETGVFLQTTDDPKIFKFHVIEKHNPEKNKRN
jgi:hypothetical protein